MTQFCDLGEDKCDCRKMVAKGGSQRILCSHWMAEETPEEDVHRASPPRARRSAPIISGSTSPRAWRCATSCGRSCATTICPRSESRRTGTTTTTARSRSCAMAQRERHPSGRPIHRPVTRRAIPIDRNPGKGPLLTRLRDPEPRDAIGFHHLRSEDEDE